MRGNKEPPASYESSAMVTVSPITVCQSKSLLTVAFAEHFVTAMIQKIMRPCTAVVTLLSQSAEAAFLRRGGPMPGSQCSLCSLLGQGSAGSKLPGRPGLHLSPAFHTQGRVEEPP